MIKLTAKQFAVIKKARAGQIVLPAIGQNKRETITLASHMGTIIMEGELITPTELYLPELLAQHSTTRWSGSFTVPSTRW